VSASIAYVDVYLSLTCVTNSSDWQQIMDSSIKVFMNKCEKEVLALSTGLDKSLVTGLSLTGMDTARLQTMANTASRACSNAVKEAFRSMRTVASDSQRDLNRSLLPLVKSRMDPGYQSGVNVQRGPGTFNRSKKAMQEHTLKAVSSMFSEATQELLTAINTLIAKLGGMVAAMFEVIRKSLENVYSVCWEDQTGKSAAIMDPVHQEKVRE
jgi:hypothetical protein